MTKFYERYWAEEGGHSGDFGLKWPTLKKFIPTGGGVIIDFGCGSGKILSEIKKLNPTAKLIGLDVSKTALQEAKKLLPEAELYKVEDGEKVPLVNGVGDFIFSSEVIEHIYDTENAVSEMNRVLKPNGKMLLTTPYHGFIKNMAITLSGKFDSHFDPIGPHVRFFSKRTLFDLLRKQGFEIEKHGFYGRFYPISHSIFVISKKLL